MRLSIFSSLMGCLVLFVLTACDQREAPPLKIGSNIWPGYEFYYMARDLGHLDPKKVRLVEFSNATDVSHQLVNGSIQAGLLTLDEVIRLKHSGLDLTVVQVVDFSRGGDVVVGRSSLENVDWKQATIAVEESAVGALMLWAFAQNIQVPVESLNVQYISVDESVDAYNKGADFVVSFEPFRTLLLNKGAKQVFDSSQVPNLIVDVLAIRNDAIKDHEQQLRHAIAEYFSALNLYRASPQKYAPLLAKRLQISAEEVQATYDGIVPATLKDNHELMDGNDPKIISSIEVISDVLLKSNLIGSPVKPTSVLGEKAYYLGL